jgi:hypothetical protein
VTGGLTSEQVRHLLSLVGEAVGAARATGRAIGSDTATWEAAHAASGEALSAVVTAIGDLQWADRVVVAGGPQPCRDCDRSPAVLYRVTPDDPDGGLDREWLCTECAARDDVDVVVLWDGAS